MAQLTGLRFEPDPSVTSATRAPVAPELQMMDRMMGGLVVNRWTYRLLRWLGTAFVRKGDTTGTTVTLERVAGHDMRVVTPDEVTGAGALLFIHGGGYVMGSPTDMVFAGVKLARALGVPVFLPGYRLGPEHPFPAALDDCHEAWRWLLDRASARGIDPARIVIGGASAGGGHAAALAQRLHDEGGLQPAAQLLVYPMLDDRTATRRELDRPRHRLWSNANNRFGWTSHLAHAPGEPSLPYAVPARREDLSGLLPAWIGVGTPDLFLDEDREYARRLSEAGVDVTYVEVDGAMHGYEMAGTALGKASDASKVEFVHRFVRAAPADAA